MTLCETAHRVAHACAHGRARLMARGAGCSVTRAKNPLAVGCALLLALVVLATGFSLVGAPHTQAWADENNAINTHQLPDSSFIYDTSIADLGGADTYYDNQTVQVVGEVIGDGILADMNGRHQWITLAASEEESTATISVYMTNESAAKIDTFGAYSQQGTTLQVRGTFHLVCSEHEGLTDLHAESVSVVAPGVQKHDTFDFSAFVPGIVMVLIGLALMAVFYYVRERQR